MKTIKLKCVQLLVNFVIITVVTGQPCSSANHLPVVNICEKASAVQDEANAVLIKADSIQNCTCELSVINQNKAIIINIQRFNNLRSSRPSNTHCGLILDFYSGSNYFWEANCEVNHFNRRQMNTNEVITIKSKFVNGTLISNEGYCMEISKISNGESGNTLELSCGIGSITSTTTTTKSTEITKKINKTTNALPITTKIVPTTTLLQSITKTTTTIDTTSMNFSKWTSTDVYMNTKHANTQLKNKDNDDTTLIAAGASVGVFVIIIVVIVVVYIYRRYHKKPTSKPVPAFDNDNDPYGMRENVLYVSSQPSGKTKPQNSVDCQDTNRISIDIDGNYSTVDLDEIPTVEESTGDYSSIDLVKPILIATNMSRSSNEKPIIAQKPKQKVAIQDDVYAVPDNKKVKHVTAPGDDMCEYAVVSKPSKSNVDKNEDQPSTSNVYAVVAKTKRISDGKVTNQKKDSLTSEIDRETGRSSKS